MIKILGSLNQNFKHKEIYCPVRKKEVLARPEEKVRVELLNMMIGELGFPQHMIAVEKKVGDLAQESLPTLSDVRVDIAVLVSSKEKEAPTPLLVIECKAVPLKDDAFRQVVGYNYYIRAPFIAVANKTELQLGWKDLSGKFQKAEFLPSYQELISVISSDIS